jgi:hypothetical protein
MNVTATIAMAQNFCNKNDRELDQIVESTALMVQYDLQEKELPRNELIK